MKTTKLWLSITLLFLMNVLVTVQFPVDPNKELLVVDLLEDYNEDNELIKKEHLQKLGMNIGEPHPNLPKKKLTKVNMPVPQHRQRRLLPFDLVYEDEEERRKETKIRRVKRQNVNSTESTEQPGTNEENYDYNQFQRDYYLVAIEEYHEVNKTAILGPEKKHKPLEEAIHTVTDIKVPRNCSDKDRNGYGLRGIECLVKDMKMSGLVGPVRAHLRNILIFWLFLYLAVVVPLWLTKGWCCCCCRCKFCFPMVIVQEVKQYVVKNPPGVQILPDGTAKTYTPSDYEISAFQSLEISTYKF